MFSLIISFELFEYGRVAAFFWQNHSPKAKKRLALSILNDYKFEKRRTEVFQVYSNAINFIFWDFALAWEVISLFCPMVEFFYN